jgi:23S rRNA (cytidine1920-2'-O)/16S rRNA (cytidine1409-2'-O)-methyltransferase
LIMARAVKVNETYPDKAGASVPIDAEIHIKGEDNPFVSRGGLKLAGALKEFNLNVEGLVAFDVGASTGGFTDCLLQHGTRRGYAIDVGYGVLHLKLRQDARGVSVGRTNGRFFNQHPGKIQMGSIDASFISLQTILPVVKNWLVQENGLVIALIKPQFQAEQSESARGEGVIRDPAVHRRVLNEVLDFAQNHGFCVEGLIRSPLLGPKGNTEFLTRLALNQPVKKAIESWTDQLFDGVC